MAGKYVLKRTTNGEFMFNLQAGNHQTILTSERYTSKSGAQTGIESVRRNSPDDDRYDRRESKAGDPYFVLKAANGEIIGKSEMYSSDSARENGIESVKANGPTSAVDDEA